MSPQPSSLQSDKCYSNPESPKKDGMVLRFVSAIKKKGHWMGLSHSSVEEGEEGGRLRRGLSSRSHFVQPERTLEEIPSDEVLERMFADVVRDTLGEDKLGSELMGRLTRENKWRMICNSGKVNEHYQNRYRPEYFFDKLGDPAAPSPPATTPSPHALARLNHELVSSLRIQLTNQPISYAPLAIPS